MLLLPRTMKGFHARLLDRWFMYWVAGVKVRFKPSPWERAVLAVLLVDEFEFDRDGGFDFFAFQHFVRGLYADFADFFRLLCDGRGHFAAFDGFDAVIGAVEADEDEVFFCPRPGWRAVRQAPFRRFARRRPVLRVGR